MKAGAPDNGDWPAITEKTRRSWLRYARSAAFDGVDIGEIRVGAAQEFETQRGRRAGEGGPADLGNGVQAPR